jgi:hypothetical protein
MRKCHTENESEAEIQRNNLRFGYLVERATKKGITLGSYNSL